MKISTGTLSIIALVDVHGYLAVNASSAGCKPLSAIWRIVAMSGAAAPAGNVGAGARRRVANAALASLLAKEEKGSSKDGTVTAPFSVT